jgi:hypothetical protein
MSNRLIPWSSVQQSPFWEANYHWASQEIPTPPRLWKLNVRHGVHNSSCPESDASSPQLPTLFP